MRSLSVEGVFAKNFECPCCHTRLTSNIVSVTNWEGALALVLLWIPFSLITRIVGESWHLNWIILIALVSVMHFAVLATFVQLEPASE